MYKQEVQEQLAEIAAAIKELDTAKWELYYEAQERQKAEKVRLVNVNRQELKVALDGYEAERKRLRDEMRTAMAPLEEELNRIREPFDVKISTLQEKQNALIKEQYIDRDDEAYIHAGVHGDRLKCRKCGYLIEQNDMRWNDIPFQTVKRPGGYWSGDGGQFKNGAKWKVCIDGEGHEPKKNAAREYFDMMEGEIEDGTPQPFSLDGI